MPPTIRTLPLVVALVMAIAGTLVTTCSHAQESADFEIGPRFRAKIAKEKAKRAAQDADTRFGPAAGGAGNAECGSQNIGNVDTGGAVGTAPREVFVFAPNAINLVSGRGCN